MIICTFYATHPFVMHDILCQFDSKQVVVLMYPIIFTVISLFLIRSYMSRKNLNKDHFVLMLESIKLYHIKREELYNTVCDAKICLKLKRI